MIDYAGLKKTHSFAGIELLLKRKIVFDLYSQDSDIRQASFEKTACRISKSFPDTTE